ncbi:outer membrane protein [Helicobacter pylori]|uniref:outer membrane protein n=1 Tax=Helicobacter pylori TaxID=210 RepID=UPI000EB5E349|nr:outer membrane beta-barrel protein [Helicobacter pylori]
MKKSFKKLGFVSLAASSVLLGSMNATDLETYAASGSAQGSGGTGGEHHANGTPTPPTPPTKEEPKYTANGTPDSSTPPAKKDETSGSGDTHASNGTPTPSTPPTKETPPATSGGTGGEHHTASSGTPTPSTPPTPTPPTSGGNTITSQLTKDTTMVNNLKSVSVSAMNTTLSGVTQLSQQTATISNLLSGNPNLGSVISNAQGLSSAFSALESAQNTLKGYLDSSSATIGQLTNGSNAVVGALDKAINQVDMALADLATADTQKTQAVALVAASDSATTTTDAINFLNALKTNLTAQKDAFMSVHKNIQTAVAQAQATYTPSVINTNNYGQMYGVDAMAGYKWFFGKTKRFGFRSYGYYSYNHANLSFVGSQLGIMEGASQVNNFTYGVGFDALYNFYESKEGYNTAGLFLGFGLGGDSFIVQGESYLKSQMHICNNTAGCSASMNTSYFQMPVEFGFRSNFSKHSGIEVGFKLPLFTNQFYKERGVDGSVDVFYKRNFSIYFNYMINF